MTTDETVREAWAPLRRAWIRSCRARNLSPRTIELYDGAAGQLIAYLAWCGGPLRPSELKRAHLEDFFVAYAENHAASTTSLVYRALQQWIGFLVDDEEIERSPMERMKPPIVPEQPVPVISDRDLTALLKSCAGTSFADRRDTAIIRLLLDTGGRRAEVAGLETSHLRLDFDELTVTGKGRRQRTLVLSPKTAQALDKYLRIRARQGKANLDALWLSTNNTGALKAPGINQMLERRGRAIGLEGLHPHQFRHTAAHAWLAAGGQESDLMRRMGWKSPQMVRRYGASLADERSREATRRLNLGDRF